MTRKILDIILGNTEWQTLDRSLWIYHAVRECSQLPGDYVEFGCGEGHSASLIKATMEMFGLDKELWCYDSFVGFPEPTSYDSSGVEKGMLTFSKQSFLERFTALGISVPKVVPGYFQNTENIGPERIAFAHLDGDLHDSILCSLRRVYGKMSKGGIILIDDYGAERFPGAKIAADLFFKDKPETVVQSCNRQGMVQKQ